MFYLPSHFKTRISCYLEQVLIFACDMDFNSLTTTLKMLWPSLQMMGNCSSVFWSPANEFHSHQHSCLSVPQRMEMFCMSCFISWQTSGTALPLVLLNTWTFILLERRKRRRNGTHLDFSLASAVKYA